MEFGPLGEEFLVQLGDLLTQLLITQPELLAWAAREGADVTGMDDPPSSGNFSRREVSTMAFALSKL